ncbi:ABC transporter substrate-binding protein [Neorhizobium sp. NCHU2750]|uniref:ABC transporter substrate-binding protein n=1 Tax=Neorhizobium sp. NCHU2750 TaxID=1825976 RepID=UPI000EB65CBC|nr:spermidine/putrescine ABC transporter substrate-binding protein [Neorhizobium sp. NCHU2750]
MPIMKTRLTRRSVLKAAGGTAVALAEPAIYTKGAFAADQITVADVGGSPGAAIKSAFYEPFENETGIKVVGVAQNTDPVSQFKLLVDTQSYIWDVSMVTPAATARLTSDKNYLAPLGITKEESTNILPGMLTENWLGFSVFAIVMAYRGDKFGGKELTSWADFWDVKKFPGRRGLYKQAWGLLEIALLADGMKPADIYPIDVERAFASLERIRPEIAVWWSSGAQNTQMLQSGEVDLSDTWSARANAAIAGGAPLKLVFQGSYSVDGWSIPVGTPRLALAQKFIKFCLQPENQANYAKITTNGPSNTKAFDFIPKERAALLPTAPENFGNLFALNSEWWGKNYDAMAERMEEFLLQ